MTDDLVQQWVKKAEEDRTGIVRLRAPVSACSGSWGIRIPCTLSSQLSRLGERLGFFGLCNLQDDLVMLKIDHRSAAALQLAK